jgi:hypothetical protein
VRSITISNFFFFFFKLMYDLFEFSSSWKWFGSHVTVRTLLIENILEMLRTHHSVDSQLTISLTKTFQAILVLLLLFNSRSPKVCFSFELR